MQKLLLLLILSFFSVQSFAGSCPDGSEPVKSLSADGTYFVYNCGVNEQSSSSTANSKIKPLAGIDIENDPNLDFFRLPREPYPFHPKYQLIPHQQVLGGLDGRIADFNNDGVADVIYIGMMSMSSNDWVPFCTYGGCSYQQIDDANKPQPAFYLSDVDGKLPYSPELFIDNRLNKGMSLGRRLLIADYNNDKFLDIYITDTSISGIHHGYRDSYYLSQPNGTWLESSNTHLSHDNFKVYDHGGATGDIDNDGDMDVVITELGGGFWCLMNNGSGFLTKQRCGGSNASSLELADMDNDGDLDAIVGGMNRKGFTGVVWNDGRGNFMPYDATPLKQHKDTYEGVPEVSASDLDNDGDMDIVYSRVGIENIGSKSGYKGSAIQFIENLGNKKFKEYGVIPIFEDSPSFIKNILFRDLDKDGDIDVYLTSMGQNIDGAVIINNGDFNFSLIMPPESYGLYEMFVDSFKAEAEALKRAEQKAEEQVLKDELEAFEAEFAAQQAKLETELAEENKSSPLFDGRYSFTISRYNENEGSEPLGDGYIEINNGIMTVAKDGRTLRTASIDLYDSFAGQINKEGNIMSSLKISALFGIDPPPLFLVDLNGSIDSQLQGKWDNYFDVILKLDKKE